MLRGGAKNLSIPYRVPLPSPGEGALGPSRLQPHPCPLPKRLGRREARLVRPGSVETERPAGRSLGSAQDVGPRQTMSGSVLLIAHTNSHDHTGKHWTYQ